MTSLLKLGSENVSLRMDKLFSLPRWSSSSKITMMKQPTEETKKTFGS